jgi:hypothetical protein
MRDPWITVKSGAVIVMFAFLGGCLKDIRPPRLQSGAETNEAGDLERRGRALLAATADAHGGAAQWRAAGTTELVFSDEWFGLARLFSPWPSKRVRAKLQFANGTFDSRAVFLHDGDKGTIWGVRDRRAYSGAPAQPVVYEQDDDILFILPTVQYFTAAPFRLSEAPIVRYVGDQKIGEREFELVYVTWGSVDANCRYDQFVVYIDKETKYLAKLFYTVRELSRFIAGAVHYDDYRPAGPFILPFSQKITAAVDDGDPVHHIELEEVTFQNAPLGVLASEPDPRL